MNQQQRDFIGRAQVAAEAAGHPFPLMAACEAALESAEPNPPNASIYGGSKLAVEGNNLFGMKEHVHPDHPEWGVLVLPTREFENGEWVKTEADWEKYPDWQACFADRVATLKRLAAFPKFIHYKNALEATNPRIYITEVSQTWSTDPNRASKVLSIYNLVSPTVA